MKIEAEIKNIKKILVDDENFYQIPDYQRPYSWDKDHLSDLISDLTNSYLNNKNENYFCGSLVLVKNNEDKRFEIIDGQQRTTTFTIMACVFRDLYFDILEARPRRYIKCSIQDEFDENKRKLRFLTTEKYQIDFEETVLKKINFQDIKQIEKDNPKNKYLQNAHHLKNYLVEQISENEIKINEFIEWFYENVVLTVITCPSPDSAIQIFNVLNDRGMPLSPIDILKSTLMQELSKDDRKAFKAKWEDINSNLNFSDLDLDGMLNTYLYYKISANPKSRLDKELLTLFKNEKKNPLEIINEISEFSKAYIEIIQSEDKYIYCLRNLRHKIYWNSILATALYVKYPQIEELKQLLVAYYYQNWIAGATVARIKQTSFNILKLIKNKKTIDEIKKEMQQNLKNYSTTKTFKEEIIGSFVYGRKWDKSILLLIEYFSSDDSNQNFIAITNKLHLEHVLPQTPTKYWMGFFDEDDIEMWTNSLANLTLLSMKKNLQAQNYTFDKKKETYQNKNNVISSFLLTQDIIKCNKWDVEELEEREERLVEKINEKLDLF